jgi:alpha-beta hydrolase superfamily lysophospholipase
LTLLFVWLGGSAFVTRKLTRRSRPAFAEPAAQVQWARLEELSLDTADGEQVGAWLARVLSPRACALVLHGNGGSRRSRLGVIQLLAQNDIAVLAISLRCHGDSSGTVNDMGYSARHDVVAAVEYLQHEYPGLRLFVVARSLGAAAALFAAEQLDDRVAGYILEQPYRDLKTATWNRLQLYLPAGLDRLAYVGLRLSSAVMFPYDADRISPRNVAKDIPECVPVLILTGSADQRTRLSEVRDIYQQIESHAQLAVFDGARHESLQRRDPQRYAELLLGFVGRRLP